MKSGRGKIIKKLLPFIGIAILVWLIFKIGTNNIVESFASARISFIILAIFFSFVVVFFQASKWFILLKKQRIKIGFLETLKFELMSAFYGIITPAKLGSFVKVAYLQKKVKNIGKSSSSVVLDKIFDFLTIFIFAFFGCLVLVKGTLFLVSLVFLFFIALFTIFINKNRSKPLLKFIYKKMLPKRFKKNARKNFYDFYDSIPNKSFLIFFLFFSFLTWIVVYSLTFIVALALNIEISYFILIFILPISTLVAHIPITIAGLGTREASLVGLLSLYGIGAAKAFSMSIIAFLITCIPALLGFFLSLKRTNKI